jgi:hypothetical protein
LGGCGVGLSESGRGRVDGGFGYDNGCSGSSKLKNCYPPTMIHSIILLRQVYKQVTNFVLCSTNLVRFPEDGPMRTETCRDIKCDIVILISMEHVSALCWFNIVKYHTASLPSPS